MLILLIAHISSLPSASPHSTHPSSSSSCSRKRPEIGHTRFELRHTFQIAPVSRAVAPATAAVKICGVPSEGQRRSLQMTNSGNSTANWSSVC
ncbi:hypothetical protein RRG08_001866 [Elysia crispata]|uniref:Secreted protein n=1 Tax=Elysia crispata TaxID=231223 RepID=A0AAE1A449_9GAST|nr:hypothetical protein RRG08_001866 [Elysia crispata]